MPLDHYVSQVHLRNFYAKNNRLTGINKNTLKKFSARSEDVCRASDGSTNEYLIEPRAVELFLKHIEPKYNLALEEIRSRRPSPDSIYVISSFVAYVMTCSPTAMRMGCPFLAASIQTVAERMEARGELGAPPEILGARNFSELIDQGKIEINVDKKYPQSIGISNILSFVNSFGNAFWEVLISNDSNNCFFTSDFPISFGPSNDKRVVSKTVPLSPDVAVRIHPRVTERENTHTTDFENFLAIFKSVKHDQLCEINRQIVRSGENIVFYNNDVEWLVRFVQKNRNYRPETTVDRITTEGGTLILARQQIKKFARAQISAP